MKTVSCYDIEMIEAIDHEWLWVFDKLDAMTKFFEKQVRACLEVINRREDRSWQ